MAKLLRRKVIEETYEIPGEDDELDEPLEAENDDEEMEDDDDDDEDQEDESAADVEDEARLAGTGKPTRKSSRTARR